MNWPDHYEPNLDCRRAQVIDAMQDEIGQRIKAIIELDFEGWNGILKTHSYELEEYRTPFVELFGGCSLGEWELLG